MLKHLDLFSGIGGWTLGFHATEEIETVGFCEIEKYPQQILKQHYPGTPIFEDVRKLDYEQLRTAGLISDTQRIDILTCSYPCQPFSVAGKKRGEEDPRHLWPEVHRLIRDDRIRPMYVLGENVGGHIRQGLDTVSEDMERSGYRWRCFSIEASCIGANHRRQRVWWIAEDVEYTNNTRDRTPKRGTNAHREKKDERRQEQSQSRVSRSSEDVADTRCEYREPRYAERVEENKKKRTSSAIQSKSSGEGSTKDVANTNDNGHEGGLFETRDQDVTGQDTQGIRRTNTKDVIRQSNDGGDYQEARANGAVSRSSDDGKTESTRTTRVCGISEESNDHQGTSREDGIKEDNDRALVQKGQKRVQSSINRGLGSDQTTLKGTEIQQGNDNDGIYRVAESKDVADTNSKRRRGRKTRGQNAEDVRQSSRRAFTRNWDVEPNVGRVANGVPNRVHRLKALGNAIVPQMAYYIGQALLKDFQHKNHN